MGKAHLNVEAGTRRGQLIRTNTPCTRYSLLCEMPKVLGSMDGCGRMLSAMKAFREGIDVVGPGGSAMRSELPFSKIAASTPGRDVDLAGRRNALCLATGGFLWDPKP
jgi:hypothetical protein